MSSIKILIPTDFSACADNATSYALELSREMSAEIILLHTVLYYASAFVNNQEKENENNQRYDTARAQLQERIDSIKRTHPDVKIKALLEEGPEKYVINEIINNEKIDYVVMGTEGASGIKAVILGSFTADVISRATCPVFAIPSCARYKKINQILCATDFHDSEFKSIEKLNQIALLFHAHISFYNVNSDKDDQIIKAKEFENSIPAIADLVPHVILLDQSKDIVNSLEGYVSKASPDIIVTLGRRRRIFENLFGNNVTKKLSLHTDIPLLSFPVINI